MENLQQRYIKLKQRLFDRYYDNLNPEQRRAVYTVKGALLILAGAGSGKTTVLVNRISHIIRYGNAYFTDRIPRDLTEEHLAELEEAQHLPKEELAGLLTEFTVEPAPPYTVLAITFTNKAANEIKNRLANQLGEDGAAEEIWAGTFHSICMRILRRFGDRLGYKNGFSVCDADESKKLVSTCMKDLNIDEKKLAVKAAVNAISRAKDKMQSPADFQLEAGSDLKQKQYAQIYTLYQQRLEAANLVDFDDIIMKTVTLLRTDDEVRDFYSRRFRYVLVDEYQDTNKAQLELTMLLSGYHGNLMVVGDDDQSIYKFRGATIENILNFDRTCPNTTVIKLEQNYRSTKTILNAANGVISHNMGRKGKNLWCDGDRGEPILVRELDTQNSESRFILDEILRLRKTKNYEYRDFAVLYRVNAQSANLETAFAKGGVPYRMLGALRFYDRKEIRDVISYLCVINNPYDNLHLKRIINEPKRKIGDTSYSVAEQIAEHLHKPVLEVIAEATSYTAIPKATATRMVEFATMMREFMDMVGVESLKTLLETVLNKTGYRDMLVAGGEAEQDRLENVDQLLSNIAEYEASAEAPTLGGFLEEVALVSDIDRYDETADAVVLMTIHSAKGLEFPVVFLPGMEEGLFPGMQSIMNPSEIEEERRLAYVAITRAKKDLIITHVRERMLYGKTQYNQLSRFVEEIPEELLDVHNLGARKRYLFGDSDDFAPASITPARPMAKTFTSAPSTARRAEPIALPDIDVGNRVHHNAFGEGMVLAVKKIGSDTMYEIAFDDHGTKKLMASYVAKILKKI
ncbi:MAG: UvrD-helicase domain-containing protein [Clostridia bacterium]|nr:UvrD-helicase domain-containing protein [Clostridia bacterium]